MSNEVRLHASAIAIGGSGVLVRGDAGSGKSSLLLSVLHADRQAQLIADDQVILTAKSGSLLASPPPALAGLLEVRGQGIFSLPHSAPATLHMVADLADSRDCPRLPTPEERRVDLCGVSLPRIFIATGSPDGPARLAFALREQSEPRRIAD